VYPIRREGLARCGRRQGLFWSSQSSVCQRRSGGPALAQDDEHAATTRAAWEAVDSTSKVDTVLYVVVTDGLGAPIS
jgi:hypothetical protein